jgi:hypothetical protein
MTTTMTDAAPPAEAVIQQWTWKTDAMKAMTLAVCELALARGLQGEFSALDLPARGAGEQGGSGIAGTVFKQLANAGIIAPVGVHVAGEFIQRRVRNDCGNPIGLWRLAHAGLARKLIAVHGDRKQPEPIQEEMLLT